MSVWSSQFLSRWLLANKWKLMTQHTQTWRSSKVTLESWGPMFKKKQRSGRKYEKQSCSECQNHAVTTSQHTKTYNVCARHSTWQQVGVREADANLITRDVFTPCAAVALSSRCLTHTLRSVPPLPPSCLFTQLPPAPNNMVPGWSYSNGVINNKLRHFLCSYALCACHTPRLCWKSENKQLPFVRIGTASDMYDMQTCVLGSKFLRKCVAFTFLQTENNRFNLAAKPQGPEQNSSAVGGARLTQQSKNINKRLIFDFTFVWQSWVKFSELAFWLVMAGNTQ